MRTNSIELLLLLLLLLLYDLQHKMTLLEQAED